MQEEKDREKAHGASSGHAGVNGVYEEYFTQNRQRTVQAAGIPRVNPSSVSRESVLNKRRKHSTMEFMQKLFTERQLKKVLGTKATRLKIVSVVAVLGAATIVG